MVCGRSEILEAAAKTKKQAVAAPTRMSNAQRYGQRPGRPSTVRNRSLPKALSNVMTAKMARRIAASQVMDRRVRLGKSAARVAAAAAPMAKRPRSQGAAAWPLPVIK